MPTSRPKDGAALPSPTLACYRVELKAPPLVPAGSKRDWMDATAQRFAYRCTPMTVANASGWELCCPFSFEAVWDGNAGVEAITVLTDAPAEDVAALIASHFGAGVLTFHPGWLFRTSPGWAIWARGSPNVAKDGIAPLEGLVETDWLPFTFTMNWRFTRPGRIRFAKGEPYCFITLAPHGLLDAIAPTLHELAQDPELEADYARWRDSRNDFNGGLRANDPAAVREGWQRGYVRGDGARSGAAFHLSKRQLKKPQPS